MSPLHSQLHEGFDRTLQRDDNAEWMLDVAATRKSAHTQLVSAQRHSSRHQVGSCEDRASNCFEKEGKSFLAGHKLLLTGIQVDMYTREYTCTRYQ